MDILSLRDPAEAPAPVVNRSTAVLISIACHLLAVLLFVVIPEQIPESLRAALRSWFAPILAQAPPPAPPPAPAVEPPVAKREQIPLKFAYVRVPEDAEQRRNPAARLGSDRDRHARQEIPTPADAQPRSNDPHSEGTTRDRVRPDPRIAEGRDSPDPPVPAATPASPPGEIGTGASGMEEAAVRTAGAGTVAEDGMTTTRDRVDPRQTAPGASAIPVSAPDGATPGSTPDTGTTRVGPSDPHGAETKFQFSNPAWLRDPHYGTMSFDTQSFPWGDYARRIYVIIRNNWLERIPLAAREGIRGWTCWHFVIGKEGAVSTLDLRRASGVPPFDRAASDALRAASPLPPLPTEFPNPEEGVTYCFYYNIYPEEVD